MNKVIAPFKGIFPAKFFTNPAYWRAFTLGLLYLAMALGQLFSYERFPEQVMVFDLPGGVAVTYLFVVLLPLSEIAALPFLFSMKVSRRVRHVSMGATVLVPVLWLLIAIWTNLTNNIGIPAGIFGATIGVVNGLWTILFAMLLLWSAILEVRELPARTNKR